MSININEISTEILTIRQFCQKYSFITESGLRWKLFSDTNFRKECSRRLGRRIYIIPQEVLSFIKEGKGEASYE